MRVIDFLSHPFKPVGVVVRERGAFLTTTPWAVARYSGVSLSPGWWRLESEGDDRELELRVSDDAGMIFASRPAMNGAVNLFVGRPTITDIDLVLCAWPGRAAFRKLAFRRLTRTEVASFVSNRIRQAMRGEGFISKAIGAAGRMMSGSTFGTRSSAQDAHLPPEAMQAIGETATSPASQVKQYNNMSFVLGEAQTLDARTLDVVEHVFRSHPEVNTVYGDVLEGGRLLPTPKWDEERARWFPLAQAPIFFRDHPEALTPQNAWSKVQESVRTYGTDSVMRLPLPLAVREGAPERAPLVPPPLPVRDSWPLVSVIIPTKHRTDLLAKCLESLRTATDYPNLEIVVVDNGADDTRLGPLLTAESAHFRIARIYDDGDFNFSRLINSGAKAAQGEILLLLNDDVGAMHSGWLHRMVDSAMDANTGAVGARLLYSSGAIQHAGVMLGLSGLCGHLWRNQTPEEAARNPHIVYPGRRMAVTGACLAVRRDAFYRVNGLDDINYPVTLNDIDFCLRLEREGFRTIYRGDAVLLHDESQSRGSDDEQRLKRERRRGETSKFLQMWGHLLDDDPFASPAFDLASENGAVKIPRPSLSTDLRAVYRTP